MIISNRLTIELSKTKFNKLLIFFLILQIFNEKIDKETLLKSIILISSIILLSIVSTKF